MADGDPLAAYRDRHDLDTAPGTAEPEPERPPLFVIHKHDASSLHYDLRIEVDHGDGPVLASWAVPKGPSTDPRDKRLAVQVEDHDLDYGDFEGRIGDGYGAGAVLVWDIGPYRNLTTDDDDHPVAVSVAIAGGKLDVWVEGDKLHGGWSLVNAKMGGDARNWLLVKHDDDGADARRNPVSTEPDSVLTGRGLADILADDPSSLDLPEGDADDADDASNA